MSLTSNIRINKGENGVYSSGETVSGNVDINNEESCMIRGWV